MCYNNYGERERNPKAKYIKRGNENVKKKTYY